MPQWTADAYCNTLYGLAVAGEYIGGQKITVPAGSSHVWAHLDDRLCVYNK